MNHTQAYIGAPDGIVLCVNDRHGREMSGVFYHKYTEEAIPFYTLGSLAFKMEELFDSIRFPFPSTNIRTFQEEKGSSAPAPKRDIVMNDETLLSKHGDLGTFIIRVQHRQNSSWQGRITWVEQDQTINFRSVWEMIKLLESAVDTVSKQDEEESEPSWTL